MEIGKKKKTYLFALFSSLQWYCPAWLLLCQRLDPFLQQHQYWFYRIHGYCCGELHAFGEHQQKQWRSKPGFSLSLALADIVATFICWSWNALPIYSANLLLGLCLENFLLCNCVPYFLLLFCFRCFDKILPVVVSKIGTHAHAHVHTHTTHTR